MSNELGHRFNRRLDTPVGLESKGDDGDPYADYLVYDTFTDDDAKALASHPPDKDVEGGGWITLAGAPTIEDNTVIAGGLSRFRIDCGNQHQVLGLRARAQGSFMRLEMRWTNANYKLGVLLRDDINQVAVYRYKGAGAESIGGGAFVFTPGTWYDVVVAYGSDGHVIVEIDGGEVCDVDEGNLVGTGTNIHFEMPNTTPPWAVDDLGIKAA